MPADKYDGTGLALGAVAVLTGLHQWARYGDLRSGSGSRAMDADYAGDIGEKIKAAIEHHRGQAHDHREEANAIDAAWKARDWAELHRIGVIDARDLAAIQAQSRQQSGSKAKLLSSTNSSAVEKKVRSAASAKFGRGRLQDAFFEHGQWFITVRGRNNDRTYSVVDAYPGFAHGLDFEEL